MISKQSLESELEDKMSPSEVEPAPGKRKEKMGGKEKRKGSDKFSCPLPGCTFVPRLASKQQMYAHYGIEHYRLYLPIVLNPHAFVQRVGAGAVREGLRVPGVRPRVPHRVQGGRALQLRARCRGGERQAASQVRNLPHCWHFVSFILFSDITLWRKDKFRRKTKKIQVNDNMEENRRSPRGGGQKVQRTLLNVLSVLLSQSRRHANPCTATM